MATTDLLSRPVTELGGLVRAGELSARELVETSLERIEALDDRVNAFCHVHADEALAAADAIGSGDERPFAGVPIAIKTEIPVAGSPMTFGSRAWADFDPQHDANLVRRFREAGFIVVGRTSMPELGCLPVTEPARFGATRNPWNLDRTPGGSSGGSGAALAAGMVPIAHAADGGGSIRIPASACGLVGLKASRGRISMGPDLGDSPLGVHGVLTRTVAETAALLDVMAGYELGDATWASPPSEPYATAATRDPGTLRVGLCLTPQVDVPVDEPCERAARDAAALLESLGHQVEEVAIPWQQPGLEQTFLTYFGAFLAQTAIVGGMLTGQNLDDVLEPLSQDVVRTAKNLDAASFLNVQTQLQLLARTIVGGTFSELDLVVTPTLAKPPVLIGTYDTNATDGMAEWGRTAQFAPFTAAFNLSGQPAISLPLSQSDDGLPIGVQIAAKPEREDVLLAVAAQLEAAAPWADRRAAL